MEKLKSGIKSKRDEKKYSLKILKIDKLFVMATYMDLVAKDAKQYKH